MHESIFEAKLLLITSTLLILLLLSVLVAALFITQKRKFRHKKQLSDMQNQFEKALLVTELKVQEQVFKSISQNLHDNIGSNISTSMLLLYKDDRMSQNEIDANTREAHATLSKVVDDLKHIARSLNPDYLQDIGLGEAIRQRIMQLEKTKRYQFNCVLPNKISSSLVQSKQLIVYYIFQEAVHNIITHAKANCIDILLDYLPEELKMVISDDGVGVFQDPLKESMGSKGSGLISMKQHAKLIGAKLDVHSKPGEGTSIVLSVPDPYQKP